MSKFVCDETKCLTATGIRVDAKTGEYRYFKNELDIYRLKKIPVPDMKWFLNSDKEFSYLPKPDEGEWLDEHKETGQTFRNFISLANSEKKSMPKDGNHILLVPLLYGNEHAVSEYVVKGLAEFVEIFYNTPVQINEGVNLNGRCKTQDCGNFKQVDTNKALSILKTFKTPHICCVIGITTCDLIDFNTQRFNFGMSEFNLKTCVSSLARYNPSFYGIGGSFTEEEQLLKACSVVCHEAGHVFGIEHCIYYRCIMNGSNSLDEDEKLPVHFCPVCLKKMHFLFKFDIHDRYVRLMNFCEKYKFHIEYEWYLNALNDYNAKQ